MSEPLRAHLTQAEAVAAETSLCRKRRLALAATILCPGHLFMLGDNRDASQDSRCGARRPSTRSSAQ